MFYVFKNNQQWGPYTQEQLNEYISAGNFHLDDLVCGEGQAEWVAAHQIYQITEHNHPPQLTIEPATQAHATTPIDPHTCPGCGNAVELQQVICVSCGFNLQKGTSTSTKTGETQRSEESVQHDKALKKYERLESIIKRVGVFFIIIIILTIILFVYKEWELEQYILYLFIPFIIMGAIIVVYRFSLSMMLIPKSHRVKLVLYVVITYILMIATVAAFWPAVIVAIPIACLAPHFFRTGIPRLNGIYTRDWPVDAAEGWKVVQGPYQEQIWNDGKLISFKQWDRMEYSMSLEKYGYREDGTTEAPLTKLPLKYRLYIEPFTSWLLWEIVKALPGAIIRGILKGG